MQNYQIIRLHIIVTLYLRYYLTELQNALSYRGDLWFWFASDVVRIGLPAVIWYAAAEHQDGIGEVQGADLVLYYTILYIFFYLTNAHQSWRVAYEIREGHFNKYLMKPISIFWTNFWRELSWRTMNLMFLLPAVGILLIVFRGQFDFQWQWGQLVVLILIPAAYFLQYTLEHVMATAAFWLDRIGAIHNVKWMMMTFTSGAAIPLILMPGWLRTISDILPFKYFSAFFYEVWLHPLSRETIAGVGILLGWSIVFYLLGIITMKFGLKRYGGYGG